MITSSNNGAFECYCPTDSLPELENSNYYIRTLVEMEFVANNNITHDYMPVPQGSLIIDQEKGEVYSYIIDSNPSAFEGQTGHWVKM